ncbi:hypothetical protein KJ628_01495 [Patescibacteria group bacterium]|nr:hypothetical protein [Patescibacteria group bacterium]
MAHIEAATPAIKMRENFGGEPEKPSPDFQNFFYKILEIEIAKLGKNMMDLAPSTIALFNSIKERVEWAYLVLAEKLTAGKNLRDFTKGTEGGIARDMPSEMIPLVITALSKITAISRNAHVAHENMRGQLPAMLMQLKDILIRQAILNQSREIEELEKRSDALETARPKISAAIGSLAHDPAQQEKISRRTSWFEITIPKIKKEIGEKEQALLAFFEKTTLFEAGATELLQPITS